ncbi:type I restriction endonuclease subunit R [Methylomonas sp. MS20]|uniref:type I restriction endonuclease subunit R n=1 Tax=unclassified Methylomonas TaxID=2608980 RepID=UPI0028A38AC1|nr:type I restriction endonuclease [Methylomonas sp. MV1]MDT4329498.1 type I restriction endonuclease [Methylomonas sp. MV1]
MTLHHEIHFETEICEHLAAHGWLYAQGDAASYDRTRALFSEDVLARVKDTQPRAWQALEKNHGAQAGEVLLGRLRDSINQRGTLDVLRHGIELIGLRQPLALAQFKPALAINPDILARYAANRLRVVRQLRYSPHNENAIDIGLFLNGIPVATAELKTDFTQSVEDAIDQYRFDREPRPKGQGNPEPLLSFPNGALVHFAVSNSEVYMTTQLAGAATRFLPFNRGNHGGAGNPAYSPSPRPSPVEGEGGKNPPISSATSVREKDILAPLSPSGRGAGGEGEQYGHRTAYLWEDIWARDSWLEILGRYLVAQKDRKNQIKNIIFPRFHQLDGTRKLLAAVLQEGAGGKYLIQHSAGSGKTNSIAWSAHFLADLHSATAPCVALPSASMQSNAAHEKLFDTVLVVSDRNVLDSQLQEAIFDFERTAGVVATIKGESASKSGELAAALSGGKKIVVCTIQTFPFALKAVRELAATQGKRFAVIADEAHSSQTGEAAAKLKAVLSAEELQELSDGGEIGTEDLLAAQMANRSAESGITYVAFTATPKAKTLELFGRRPNPDLPADADNLPAPFHVYSMRQAIEEGFILDVLKNYTPYKLAFKLAHDGKELDDKEVERGEALKGIMRWVRLHPYNISQKVQVVVEHFRENVAPLLNGKAKAMVVVGSRVEAVRWRLAIDKYIKENGYKIGTLVAFSGEVNDPQSGADPFSETSHAMNPALKGQDIREAFNTDDYQILLVANKFQTGFDQPLLCGMYVDKRLAGIAAVQTLSRLNRAYQGKDTTYVVDFVNAPEDILAAFKAYYETAELSNVTDPHRVFDLRMKLDATGFYDEFEVNRVVDVEFNPHAKQSELAGALEPVVSRLLLRYKAAQDKLNIAKANEDGKAAADAQNELDALILFKHDMTAFQRMYAFLSQIFDYGNTAIEKRFIFYRRLLPLLAFGREREGIDLSKVILTHHNLKRTGKRDLALETGEYKKLEPMNGAGSGSIQEKEKAYLVEIIAKVNDLFEGDLTDDDRLVYVNSVIKGKLLESTILVTQAANNTKEQFANSPDFSSELLNAIIDAFAAHNTMSKQALDSARVRGGLREILLGPAQLYEALRERAGAGVAGRD